MKHVVNFQRIRVMLAFFSGGEGRRDGEDKGEFYLRVSPRPVTYFQRQLFLLLVFLAMMQHHHTVFSVVISLRYFIA